jgi:hypothetical protein
MPERKPRNVGQARAALVAAERAREAWDAAWRYAGSVGLETLPEHDRQRLEQAQKILAQAADHATTPAERAVCIDRLVTLLTQVTAVDRNDVRHTVTKFVSAQLAIPAPATFAAITARKTSTTLVRSAMGKDNKSPFGREGTATLRPQCIDPPRCCLCGPDDRSDHGCCHHGDAHTN